MLLWERERRPTRARFSSLLISSLRSYSSNSLQSDEIFANYNDDDNDDDDDVDGGKKLRDDETTEIFQDF